MRSRAAELLLVSFLLGSTACWAVIIDRIAIVIDKSIIKDSDIERDMRVTELLNGEPLATGSVQRKAAASRLIDQIFIRKEIDVGGYGNAPLRQAEQELEAIRKERYKSDRAFEQALRRFGLTDLELRTQFQWQLTVLQFIEARFKPAAYVSDEEIETYYKEHSAALRRQTGKSSLNDLRQTISETVAGEKVNKLFFAWLDDQRKSSKIDYREAGLK